MAKLSKSEREKLEVQMALSARRGSTWVGIRPTVFKSRKNDKKTVRRQNRALCRNY